jgi:hypothetical protein
MEKQGAWEGPPPQPKQGQQQWIHPMLKEQEEIKGSPHKKLEQCQYHPLDRPLWYQQLFFLIIHIHYSSRN